MSLNQEDVRKILNFLAASNFEELDLKMADLHLVVSKRQKGACRQEPPATRQESGIALQPERRGPEAAVQPEATRPGKTSGGDSAEQTVPEGLVPVVAPTLGIFYRSPKPGAPPFVEQEELVKETDTICIIEVMKLFNHIKAGVKGRVVRVCAEDATMVEHGQVIFLIEPTEN